MPAFWEEVLIEQQQVWQACSSHERVCGIFRHLSTSACIISKA